MKKLASFVVLLAISALVWASGPEGGVWRSPGGTVVLDVAITDHLPLPTVVNLTVTEKKPVPPGGGTHTGTGTGGNQPNTCADYGPIVLESGHKYRIKDGKHQWHNKNWTDPNAWQNMNQAQGGLPI